MKVLFLTIGRFDNIQEQGVYTDLLRKFKANGHDVYVVCARERRQKKPTEYVEDNGIHILRVKIGNITKTKNLVKKGVSTLLLDYQYKKAIKKYLKHVNFDLVLYSTPPITLSSVINHIKKKHNARTYLLLKDIFPQNAVDLGMLSKTGIKSIVYKYFRQKEKRLYTISDRIGCMSKANVEYVLKHNPEVSRDRVEICPNSIEIRDMLLEEEERIETRQKYGLPLDKKVFVYGGNLGKPQGIPFIIQCLKTIELNSNAFFLIVGDGTEYGKLVSYVEEARPQNIRLLNKLPKEEYDRMIASCDVGMIFLDHRFTIPNFPSRLLSYMQAGLPVLACTDLNTDIGQIITEGGFGWWCESNNPDRFADFVNEICSMNNEQYNQLKNKSIQFLYEHYSIDKCYEIIMKEFVL